MNCGKQWQEEVHQQQVGTQEKTRCLYPKPTIEGWFMTYRLLQYMLQICVYEKQSDRTKAIFQAHFRILSESEPVE